MDNSKVFQNTEEMTKEELLDLVDFLKNELKRKNDQLESLRTENTIIMKTAIKQVQEQKSLNIK